MNCGKLRLSLLVIAVLVCFILIARTEAQLTFSTGWGKRSQPIITKANYDQPRALYKDQPDNDFIRRYYQHLRKMEAELLGNSQV